MAIKAREEHPELKSDRNGWAKFCGVERPVIPSQNDPHQEAQCLSCRDAGWIISVGDIVKPCPHCQGAEAMKSTLRSSGIPESKQSITFSDILPVQGAREAISAAYDLGLGYAEFYLLLIYGVSGNGKTTMAYCAAIEAKKRGLNIRFEVVKELYSKLRSMMHDNQNSDNWIQTLMKSEFVVLDDLDFQSKNGLQSEVDWQHEIIEMIVNYRYAHMLPLIATMNKDPKQLTEPVLRRFRDPAVGRVVFNRAPEYKR